MPQLLDRAVIEQNTFNAGSNSSRFAIKKTTLNSLALYTPGESECEDSGQYIPEQCLLWKNAGLCEMEKFEMLMSNHCKKTCGCTGKRC